MCNTDATIIGLTNSCQQQCNILFKNIFDLQLVGSMDMEPTDTEGWL